MADQEPRDRVASQRHLRQAIDGLDAAPRVGSRRSSSRIGAQVDAGLGAWRAWVTPLRLTAVLAGVTLIVLVTALATA